MYAYLIFASGLARHFGQYHMLDRDPQSESYTGGLLSGGEGPKETGRQMDLQSWHPFWWRWIE